MEINELIDALYQQEDKRLHGVANLLAKTAERCKAGEVGEETLKNQLENVGRMLEIYQIKDKVKHKAIAQKVEDLLIILATKGVAPLVKNIF
jgi:hypothetical protein